MRNIHFIFLSLALICTSAQLSAQNLTKIKKEIQASVEQQKDQLIATSDAIWEAAETSLEEYKSSKQLKDYARANGFTVTENVADISTAFMASYGSGRPIIGILGEFDANAGISQKRQPTREARVAGEQDMAADITYWNSSLGAAIAIKEQIEKGSSREQLYFMVHQQKKPSLLKFGWPVQGFSISWMYVWIGTLGLPSKPAPRAAKPWLIFA